VNFFRAPAELSESIPNEQLPTLQFESRLVSRWFGFTDELAETFTLQSGADSSQDNPLYVKVMSNLDTRLDAFTALSTQVLRQLSSELQVDFGSLNRVYKAMAKEVEVEFSILRSMMTKEEEILHLLAKQLQDDISQSDLVVKYKTDGRVTHDVQGERRFAVLSSIGLFIAILPDRFGGEVIRQTIVGFGNPINQQRHIDYSLLAGLAAAKYPPTANVSGLLAKLKTYTGAEVPEGVAELIQASDSTNLMGSLIKLLASLAILAQCNQMLLDYTSAITDLWYTQKVHNTDLRTDEEMSRMVFGSTMNLIESIEKEVGGSFFVVIYNTMLVRLVEAFVEEDLTALSSEAKKALEKLASDIMRQYPSTLDAVQARSLTERLNSVNHSNVTGSIHTTSDKARSAAKLSQTVTGIYKLDSRPNRIANYSSTKQAASDAETKSEGTGAKSTLKTFLEHRETAAIQELRSRSVFYDYAGDRIIKFDELDEGSLEVAKAYFQVDSAYVAIRRKMIRPIYGNKKATQWEWGSGSTRTYIYECEEDVIVFVQMPSTSHNSSNDDWQWDHYKLNSIISRAREA
jgi:hypothetical protein